MLLIPGATERRTTGAAETFTSPDVALTDYLIRDHHRQRLSGDEQPTPVLMSFERFIERMRAKHPRGR